MLWIACFTPMFVCCRTWSCTRYAKRFIWAAWRSMHVSESVDLRSGTSYTKFVNFLNGKICLHSWVLFAIARLTSRIHAHWLTICGVSVFNYKSRCGRRNANWNNYDYYYYSSWRRHTYNRSSYSVLHSTYNMCMWAKLAIFVCKYTQSSLLSSNWCINHRVGEWDRGKD